MGGGSFFDDQLNLITDNRFDMLSKNKNVMLSSNSSKETRLLVLLLYSRKWLNSCQNAPIYDSSGGSYCFHFVEICKCI